jgi:NAD(P)-dependent dehydrogenase (short-subunit alcohol dehydrogenase family)
MLLEGKSVVVTGGNSGIGEAIVIAAAAEGANVVIDYVVHPEETTALIAKSRQPAVMRWVCRPMYPRPPICTR